MSRIRTILLTAAPLVALLLAVGGCHRETTPAVGKAATQYFPLVPGAHWIYALRSSLGSLTLEVDAKGEMPVKGHDFRLFVMNETNKGPSFGFVRTSPVGYTRQKGYFARYSAVDYDRKGGLRLLGQDAPTWILPVDPHPGDSWVEDNHMFGNPDETGASLHWTGEVRPVATLRVPAGTFHDVLEVRSTYRDPNASGNSTLVYTDYYAKGVGLIRSVTNDANQDQSKRLEQVLLRYHFPRTQP